MFRTDLGFAMIIACAASSSLAAQYVIHEWVSDPIPPDTWFGTSVSVAGLGDVDLDGYPDVFIAASATSSNGLQNNGEAFVYSGRTGTRLFTITGTSNRQYNGGWGLPVADFDGDGRPDFATSQALIVGNESHNRWEIRSGLDGRVLRPASGLARSLSPLRDLDGDGVVELLFVDPYWIPPGSRDPHGRAELRSGRTDALLHVITGQSYVEAITHTSPVGDVDGDGFDDLLFRHAGDWPYVGAAGVSVFSGRPPYALIHRIWPQRGSDSFGVNAAGPGDLDGDGYADIAISDLQYRVTNPDALVYTFSGRTGAAIHVLAPEPWMSTYQFGDLLAAPGDVDGDGFDDLAVTFGDAALRWAGNVIYSGRDASILAIIRAEGAWPHHAGDLDLDDFPDLLVGNLGTVVNNQLVDRRVRAYSLRDIRIDVLGDGCAPTGTPIPRIGASRHPLRGVDFEVHLSRTEPNLPAFLIVGLSATQWGTMALPLDLSTLGLSGCSLLTAIDAVIDTATSGVPSNGHATAPIPIPAHPALTGQQFFAQWVVAAPTGPALTRALACTIE